MTNSTKTSSSTKPQKSKRAASALDGRWNKEELLQSFCTCTGEAVEKWETFFGVEGLGDQVLGGNRYDIATIERLRRSNAWETLMALFDYATQGITEGMEEMSIVLDAAEILSLVRTESQWPSDEWMQILTMGDARYALDEGSPLTIERVALLGNVDVRTVRNAISAGDLVALQEDKSAVDNASARRWLLGRKGFRQTVNASDGEHRVLEQITTAAQFGVFLAQQRKRIGLGGDGQKVTLFHPGAGSDTLVQLEAGVFTLPLDAVFPIADFYQLSRKALLECVMRVFFSRELEILSEIHPK